MGLQPISLDPIHQLSLNFDLCTHTEKPISQYVSSPVITCAYMVLVTADTQLFVWITDMRVSIKKGLFFKIIQLCTDYRLFILFSEISHPQRHYNSLNTRYVTF